MCESKAGSDYINASFVNVSIHYRDDCINKTKTTLSCICYNKQHSCAHPMCSLMHFIYLLEVTTYYKHNNNLIRDTSREMPT